MTNHITCPPTQARGGSGSTPDFESIKKKQQATWSSGDFSVVGVCLQSVSEKLCEAVDLRAGQRVLDVATGAGTTALAAARCWTEVIGVDFVPALLERGRERAAAERLSVEFREADSEKLPFEDGSFDAVLSTFGAMFAPDHVRTASELVRVCKKGGKIGLANWTPEGYLGDTFRLIGKYVPPIAGLESPLAWGSEAHLRKLFGSATKEIRIQRQMYSFRFESFAHWLDIMRTFYGPMHKTYLALEAPQQAALTREFEALNARRNRSGDSTIVIDGEYLEVVITKA